jgi:hypothetical protein
MTKLTLVAAALVAAAAYTSEASAARSNEHSRVTATTSNAVDCLRAPNVGAFASAPYTSPPCMPNAAN